MKIKKVFQAIGICALVIIAAIVFAFILFPVTLCSAETLRIKRELPPRFHN